METINFYQPIIRPVANNGSDRFGFTLETEMWETADRKIGLSIHGKTPKEARDKFENTMFEENVTQNELKCEYYLCNKSVVDKFKPFEVSKPFKSGYDWDNDEYYVAWLNFEEVERFYNSESESEIDFTCYECVPGQMDVSNLSMRASKKNGFFSEIENHLSITKDRNRAYIIQNLSNQFGCTPVQLINKYL